MVHVGVYSCSLIPRGLFASFCMCRVNILTVELNRDLTERGKGGGVGYGNRMGSYVISTMYLSLAVCRA